MNCQDPLYKSVSVAQNFLEPGSPALCNARLQPAEQAYQDIVVNQYENEEECQVYVAAKVSCDITKEKYEEKGLVIAESFIKQTHLPQVVVLFFL